MSRNESSNSLPPAAFLRRMEGMLGSDYPAFLASYREAPSRGLFLPAGRLTPEAFAQVCDFPVEKLPYLPGGYRFDTEKPGNHPLHHAGAFYVQDPSAMATVSAAPLRKGMRCLDLCASPGGKSVQLAAGIGCDIGQGGFLISNEFSPSRCKVLCSNLERMSSCIGSANTLVSNADAARVARWYPAFFDLVLVDAPCSGEGMFRKDSKVAGEWTEGATAFCARRQSQILQEAAKAVAPGGYLLYSTCTFSEEENEGVTKAFLGEHPAFSLCKVPVSLQAVTAPGIDLPEARRWYPHLAPGEGQYFVLLQRADAGMRAEYPAFSDARQVLNGMELDAVTAFLEDALVPGGDLTLCKLKNGQIAAANFPVPAENVFAVGITLGTVEKRRLVPHHQLFKALGSRFLRKIELGIGDERVRKYLSGGEILCDCDCGDGWAVVTLCGCVLGGAKVSGRVAKNHYPKGLRLPPN